MRILTRVYYVYGTLLWMLFLCRDEVHIIYINVIRTGNVRSAHSGSDLESREPAMRVDLQKGQVSRQECDDLSSAKTDISPAGLLTPAEGLQMLFGAW